MYPQPLDERPRLYASYGISPPTVSLRQHAAHGPGGRHGGGEFSQASVSPLVNRTAPLATNAGRPTQETTTSRRCYRRCFGCTYGFEVGTLAWCSAILLIPADARCAFNRLAFARTD